MLAVRLEQYGHPPVLTDVPDPRLQGQSDVIVQVEGAGVCRTDLHAINGELADVFPTPMPFTLGHEVAGVVVETGTGVRNVSEGDKVVLHPQITCGLCPACRRGEDNHCSNNDFMGLAVDGGMAQFVRTTERAVVPLAASSSTTEVAPLADAGITAYHAISRAAKDLTSESVAVVLGCGGLGHLAIQMLRAMTDSCIVAVDRLPEARDLAKTLGADFVAGDDVAAIVEEASRGTGATVVFDFVGEGDAPALAVSLLAVKGLYAAVGYGGVCSIPTLELVLKEVRVQGNLVGTSQDLRELIALYERGLLESRVTTYSLSEALQAISDLEAGHIRGRAVLVP
jgi:NAD+-dependent secondary alcohol dehydrogenase Adh1